VCVDGPLEDLAGLERQHATTRYHDLVAGLRIAGLARPLFVDDEVAEARDLALLALFEPGLDHLEDRLDDLSGFFLRKSDALVDVLDDLGFGHARRLRSLPAGT